MKHPIFLIPSLFSVCLILPSGSSAADWFSWRGPNQNGVSLEVDLPAKLGLDPKNAASNLLWRAPYPNRSTPIIMNGRVYINNGVGEKVMEQERVMCLDADTGKKIWEKRFDIFHTDIVSVRLGWANLAGDPRTGNIYWHGTQGHFICFDKDGKILWRRSLTEEFGRVTGYGGRVNSPTVDEDLVIIGMACFGWGSKAKGACRYLAMNKNDGKVVWWWESPYKVRTTYYSQPIVTTINGQRVLITGGADGWLHCMKVRTGEHVWSYPISKSSINSSPVVLDNYVYICHGSENVEETNVQGGVFCLDASKVEKGRPALVWKELGLECKYATPILHDGKLYVCSDIARLYCMDAKTGKKLWRRPAGYGLTAKGSPVLADGKIYAAPVEGAFAIVEPGPKKGTVIDSVQFQSPDGIEAVETYGTPAIANGRIYIGTTEGLYCFGKKDHKGKAVATPSDPPQPPLGPPAAVRIYPAEVAIEPGEKVQFQLQALDSHGRVVKSKLDGSWSLPPLPKPPLPPFLKKGGPPLKGEISQSGVFTADAKTPEQAGLVEVKTKLGTAQAHVRVVPKLPYAENFDGIANGYSPLSWINTQGKFFVATLKDGNKVLRNNNKVFSPLVSKAEAYIGKPEWTNLTIEADAQTDQVDQDLADMGLIANRYRLLLWGNKQVLRLDSWDAMPRVAVAVPFQIKPNVWYRLKLSAQVNGKTAMIRGKAWPRDQAEPKAWQIEFTDPNPNPSGCPGLYRFGAGIQQDRPGCTVYFDNVRITPNKKS